MDYVIVTRHQALVEYIHQHRPQTKGAQVLERVTEKDISGKCVVGVLPLRLAAFAKEVTEVGLNLPRDLRGTELSLEQITQYTTGMTTYVVKDRFDVDELIKSVGDLVASESSEVVAGDVERFMRSKL